MDKNISTFIGFDPGTKEYFARIKKPDVTKWGKTRMGAFNNLVKCVREKHFFSIELNKSAVTELTKKDKEVLDG